MSIIIYCFFLKLLMINVNGFFWIFYSGQSIFIYVNCQKKKIIFKILAEHYGFLFIIILSHYLFICLFLMQLFTYGIVLKFSGIQFRMLIIELFLRNLEGLFQCHWYIDDNIWSLWLLLSVFCHSSFCSMPWKFFKFLSSNMDDFYIHIWLCMWPLVVAKLPRSVLKHSFEYSLFCMILYGAISLNEIYRNFTVNITTPAMPGYGFMEMMIQMSAYVSWVVINDFYYYEYMPLITFHDMHNVNVTKEMWCKTRHV